jgi:transcription factor TFIIIB component B''
MSHPHTAVSASVIKSTSRFAPKAVPRKKALTNIPPPKPTPAPTVEEPSDSEDELEEEPRIDLEEDTEVPTGTSQVTLSQRPAGRNIEGVPTIQSSIPTSLNQATPILAPTVVSQPTRSLRSSGPVHEPPATPSTQSTELVLSTSSTSRKRRHTTISVEESTHRRRRRSTPPTAEQVVIIPATMTMSEMCIDKRTGRKSSRYAELQEAERQRRKLRELKREQQQSESQDDPPEEPTVPVELPTTTPEDESDELLPVGAGAARVIADSDGNFRIDQSSLQVSRHAIHPSALTDSLVHTTETVFSSKTNSSTYASTRTHASNTIRWLPSDNERFFTALRMFGTDFGMISTYLGGGKSRRHVKNKFDREEKSNPDKVTWALKNKLAVDIVGMEEKRGTKLRGLEEMKEELEGIRAEARAVMALPRISQQNGDMGSSRKETLLGDL